MHRKARPQGKFIALGDAANRVRDPIRNALPLGRPRSDLAPQRRCRRTRIRVRRADLEAFLDANMTGVRS